MGTLKMHVNIENDNTCEVFLKFELNNFSGFSSAWFEIEKFIVQAAQFSQYPLSIKNPPKLEGGYWNPGATEIQQEHLHISAFPINARGALGLLVRVAVPHEQSDREGVNFSASAEFVTDYEQLAQFSKDMQSLVRGEIKEVVLQQIN